MSVRGLRVAALAKQVPLEEDLALSDDGRLVRSGAGTQMNAFCRRAVAQAVQLAGGGGRCVVVTMGPPSSADVLREAAAFGADETVLLSDPAWAGADALVTARALAAALAREGPFDVVLVGHSTMDGDTGLVGPQVAALLDMPFVGPVTQLEPAGAALEVTRHGDGTHERVLVRLPAVVSAAERLCAPAKVPAERWPDREPARTTYSVAQLGMSRWPGRASPTWVGRVRRAGRDRAPTMLAGRAPADMVTEAVDLLVEAGALGRRPTSSPVRARTERPGVVPPARPDRAASAAVLVVVHDESDDAVRALLGAAAGLAGKLAGGVVVVGAREDRAARMGAWGADSVIVVDRHDPAPFAHAVVELIGRQPVRAVLSTATGWGREVLSRAAVALDAGIVADAVRIDAGPHGLVGVKPAFGGSSMVEITATGRVQMATMRVGAMPVPQPRRTGATARSVAVPADPRCVVLDSARDDDWYALDRARTVLGVGQGVAYDDYALLDRLRGCLGAELAATRKVTDLGWLPRSRQIGITGRSISPRLYVALGTSGKLNHLIGVRGAGTVLGVNSDRGVPLFDHCDVGIVADWRDVAEALATTLAERGLATPRLLVQAFDESSKF